MSDYLSHNKIRQVKEMSEYTDKFPVWYGVVCEDGHAMIDEAYNSSDLNKVEQYFNGVRIFSDWYEADEWCREVNKE